MEKSVLHLPNYFYLNENFSQIYTICRFCGNLQSKFWYKMDIAEIEKIENLLLHWKKFRENGGENLVDFADWLKKRQIPEKEPINPVPVQVEQFMIQNPVYAQIGYFWGRLNRYASFWAKKAFTDLPIKTVEEFGILMFVKISENPRKSEVSENSLLETSTCLEIIKRLVRQGFLIEQKDQKDKRSVRISLTETGLGVLFQSLQKMQEISHLLSAELPEKQQHELLAMFQTLDHFHFNLLQKAKEKNWEQIKLK